MGNLELWNLVLTAATFLAAAVGGVVCCWWVRPADRKLKIMDAHLDTLAHQFNSRIDSMRDKLLESEIKIMELRYERMVESCLHVRRAFQHLRSSFGILGICKAINDIGKMRSSLGLDERMRLHSLLSQCMPKEDCWKHPDVVAAEEAEALVPARVKNPIIANFFHQIGRADELGSGVRNLYHYVRIYSGADPVFDEGDIFRLTVPLDDDYSPEKGHLQKRQTIQAGVRQTRQHGGFQECSDALWQIAVANNEPYNDTYKEPDNEPHNGETLTPSERKFLSFVEQAGSLSLAELRTLMCVRNVSDFHARYIRPMLKRGLIEHTLPNAKRSKFQKYRLTVLGCELVARCRAKLIGG